MGCVEVSQPSKTDNKSQRRNAAPAETPKKAPTNEIMKDNNYKTNANAKENAPTSAHDSPTIEKARPVVKQIIPEVKETAPLETNNKKAAEDGAVVENINPAVAIDNAADRPAASENNAVDGIKPEVVEKLQDREPSAPVDNPAEHKPSAPVDNPIEYKPADEIPKVEANKPVEINKPYKVSVHPHELELIEKDNGWACDGIALSGGCASGITGFYQTTGMKRFSCTQDNFDICEKCLQKYLI